MRNLYAIIFAALVLAATGSAEEWSRQLLKRVASAAEAGRQELPTAGREVSSTPAEAMKMVAYQLRNLDLASSVGSDVVDVLRELLPAASSVTLEVASNSLYVMTSIEAHSAVSLFLRTVDADPAHGQESMAMPDGLLDSLEELSRHSENSEELLQEFEGMRSELANIVGDQIKSEVQAISDELGETQQTQTTIVVVALLATVACVAGIGVYLTVRSRRTAATAASTALAISEKGENERVEMIKSDVRATLKDSLVLLRQGNEEHQKQLSEEAMSGLKAYESKVDQFLDVIANRFDAKMSESVDMIADKVNERLEENTEAVQKIADANNQAHKLLAEINDLADRLERKSDENEELQERLRLKELELERQTSEIAAFAAEFELEDGPVEIDGTSDLSHLGEPKDDLVDEEDVSQVALQGEGTIVDFAEVSAPSVAEDEDEDELIDLSTADIEFELPGEAALDDESTDSKENIR